MAGDWIKIETALPSKPEVMQIAAILGIDDMAVVGHLVCFWSWVDENLSLICPVARGTKSGLDRVAMRDGFTDAMLSVGWLIQEEDGGYRVPNYDEHLSKSAKQRALDWKKKKRQRASVPNLSPDLSRICPDARGTKTGLEKRREEKSITNASALVNTGRARQKFQKPTPQEVGEYAQSIGFTLEGASFCDYYEARGWLVGKSPMKDWRSAVRTWKRHADERERPKQQPRTKKVSDYW